MAVKVASEASNASGLKLLGDYRSEDEDTALDEDNGIDIDTSGAHELSSANLNIQTDLLAEELRLVDKLNMEAFPALMLGKVDDLLVHTFFKHKTRKQGSSWFRPSTLFPLPPRSATRRGPVITTEPGTRGTDPLSLDEQGKAIGKALVEAHPDLFPPKLQSCIDHLASRYLMVWHGPRDTRTKRLAIYRLIKSGSIIARRAIPTETLLHELCGCMSSDVVTGFDVDEAVFPMMQAQESQLGPTCIRLLLGPFRFVQHDCKPNCRVVAIEGTHAYGVQSMRDIKLGEFLTVDRSAGNYAGKIGSTKQACRCRSCDPPLEADARVEKIKKRNRTRSLARRSNKRQKLEADVGGQTQQETGAVEDSEVQPELLAKSES